MELDAARWTFGQLGAAPDLEVRRPVDDQNALLGALGYDLIGSAGSPKSWTGASFLGRVRLH